MHGHGFKSKFKLTLNKLSISHLLMEIYIFLCILLILYLQTHQTIFFCILSVFNSSVMTFNLKAGGGI